HERRYRADRQIKQFRIVSSAINQRETEVNEFTGRLECWFFCCKLDHCPNTEVEEFSERTPVSSVTNPNGVRGNLPHVRLSAPTGAFTTLQARLTATVKERLAIVPCASIRRHGLS